MSRSGEITDLISLERLPTPEELVAIGSDHAGMVFRFLQSRIYSETEIEKLIAESLEGYDLMEGPPRPGVRYL